MKYIKEYYSYNKYSIKSWDDNYDLSIDDPNYNNFIVDLELNGDVIEISIPYMLFYNFIKLKSDELRDYIDKKNHDGAEIFIDLEDIGVNIEEWLLEYCELNIPKDKFYDLDVDYDEMDDTDLDDLLEY